MVHRIGDPGMIQGLCRVSCRWPLPPASPSAKQGGQVLAADPSRDEERALGIHGVNQGDATNHADPAEPPWIGVVLRASAVPATAPP